jgi:hypothetical protein
MRKWLILALTIAWLAWELIAAFDGSSYTWPLTEVVVTYVPPYITLPAIGILVVWLPAHFAKEYRKQAKHQATWEVAVKVGKYAKAIVGALVAGGGAAAQAMSDGDITTSEWVTIGLAALAALGVVWAVPNSKEAQGTR